MTFPTLWYNVYMVDLDAVLGRKEMRARALREALSATVERLKGLGALRVTLFGSLAQGEIGPRQ